MNDKAIFILKQLLLGILCISFVAMSIAVIHMIFCLILKTPFSIDIVQLLFASFIICIAIGGRL